jgi:hypothetical protein
MYYKRMTNVTGNLSMGDPDHLYPWEDDNPWCHHPVMVKTQFAGTREDKGRFGLFLCVDI